MSSRPHSSAPVISFRNGYYSFITNNVTADVDLSVDGGKSWQNVWRETDDNVLSVEQVTIPIPQAARKSDVKVRFHFVAAGRYYGWVVDNVDVGTTCDPVSGGLVSGFVTDANTGDPVDGASVAGADTSSQPGISAATDDPNLPDGFYTAFSSHTGSTALTATAHGYAETTGQADVTKDDVVHQDWVLDAGRLAVTSSAGIPATTALGQAATTKVTLTNTGSAAMHVDLGAQGGSYTALGQTDTMAAGGGAVLRAGSGASRTSGGGVPAAGTATDARAGSDWTKVAPYPFPIAHNAVAYDARTGDVYSVGGSSTQAEYQMWLDRREYNMTAQAFVHHPGSDNWAPITPAPQPLARAQATFLEDRKSVV